MFIQTEDTPNPNSLKFLPGQAVLGEGAIGMDFPNAPSASASPFAQALFAVSGVEGIFLGADFVTVTRDPDTPWSHIKPAVLSAIADHLSAGLPILADGSEGAPAPDGPATPLEDYDEEDRQTVEQIIEILDTRVRPAVASDGGDIVFKHYEPSTGVVFLAMRGACAGCPSSTMTLKSGIENLLKHFVPQVQRVEEAQ